MMLLKKIAAGVLELLREIGDEVAHARHLKWLSRRGAFGIGVAEVQR